MCICIFICTCICIRICICIQLLSAIPPPCPRTHRKAIARPSKNRPSWDTNPFKNRTKWRPKWFKIASKRPLGGVWGGLGAILAPRWPQEAKNLRKSISGVPSWEACWGPKSQKIAPKSDPEGDDFFIVFGIDFGSHFVPTWLQLGSQNPPKMEPSWDQNRCKLGY